MGLRESFGELDTGVKILVVLAVGFVGLIGVIVVTVVFAAIIGSFVLGVGSQVDAAPQAAFTFQVDGGAVEVVHDGGEFVAADRLVVAVNGDGRTWATLDPDVSSGGTVEAGDSVTVTGVASGDTMTVRWVSPDGDQSTVLDAYEVP